LSFVAGYHADAAHNGSFVWSDYSSGSAVVTDTTVNQFVARASGGVKFYSNEGMTSGVSLAAGSGTWSSLSDRSAKMEIVPLDDASVLAKVAALPIDEWRYKSESGVRHVGPMAQDFYAALAAIKALHRENGQLRTANLRLQTRLSTLEAKVDALTAIVRRRGSRTYLFRIRRSSS
jgi:Chaperone of endosialidase